MSHATNTPTVPAPPRKPRLLWANAYCLLDTSSGANMAVLEMLRQLLRHGYEIEIVGATVFDHERGALRLRAHWEKVQACLGGVIEIRDGDLLHRLAVTASTHRPQMTCAEEALWFQLYQRALDDFKPDLVFYYGGQVLDMLIPVEAHARGVPVAAYLANGNFTGTRWCRDVDLILTDSQASADMYADTQGYRVRPVGAFIDPAPVLAANNTRERVLFINPSREKGVGVVIQLALLLERRRPDIVFEVVESRGNWQEMLEQTTAALGNQRAALANVVVTPNTDDMRPVYGRARLLLAPSLWWESSGRVLAEAMLNGIPAIVTDRAGMPEMIQDGGIRLQLPPECHVAPYTRLPELPAVAALADAIVALFDDADLYADYVARAYRVGQSLHGLEASTQRLLAAFQPLIERRAGDGPPQEATHRAAPAPVASQRTGTAQPKISVIFPVYHRQAFLREALESVLAQSFGDFELLIVHDGVCEPVRAIVDSYRDARIRSIELPINLGISTARNAGLRAASAPLIALMDSDDVALPERFARQHAFMHSHPDVTVCASNAIKLLSDGRQAPMRYPETDAMIKARLLLVDSAMLNPTTMLRTGFLRRHAIEYDANFPRDHDHRLFVDMMRKGARFHGLQEELLLYRRHGGNATTDRTGVDAEKNRVREIVLPAFFPELTGAAHRILMMGMGEQVHMTLDEARQFVAVAELALRETRSFLGEDRAELAAILGSYRQRMLQSLQQPVKPD
jgi:glycosyltransferase involved in cell wall biosynthesis